MKHTGRHIEHIDDLAASIRDARRGMGATQSELAGFAGVGVRFVSEVENGKWAPPPTRASSADATGQPWRVT